MIIDSFLFFNETELVELRVKYLNKIVDHFVIVEADITHQGKKKAWNFPKILESNLKAFSNKIQYHQLDIDIDKIKNVTIDENSGEYQTYFNLSKNQTVNELYNTYENYFLIVFNSFFLSSLNQFSLAFIIISSASFFFNFFVLNFNSGNIFFNTDEAVIDPDPIN